MNLLNRGIIVSLTCLFVQASAVSAAEQSLAIEGTNGASATFVETEAGWRWSRLTVAGGPAEGWAVRERSTSLATPDREGGLALDWTLVEHASDRLVVEQAALGTGLQVRRVYSFGPSTNVIRIETWVRSTGADTIVARVGLLDLRVRGEYFYRTGDGPASFPLFSERLFAGIEHVSGEASNDDASVQLTHRPRITADSTWRQVAPVVIGWALPEMDGGPYGDRQLRQAFLHYLDSVRLKPDRMVLHSETWWTLPPPLREADVLKDIESLRKGFHERTGLFFDTYCLDLGWSDPRTFWEIARQQFPNNFDVVNERLAGLGAKLGLWMSPGSGYPDGLSNSWLQAQGYEMTPFESLGQAPCFALGTRYQRVFRERLVSYAQQYGLGHVILDFINHRCDVPGHGHPVGPESRYAIDAGIADVLDALLAVNPNIALEPMVCGYPPSPWWLMKTPFILGPAGDDVPYGRVASPEWLDSLITARGIAYRTSQESWLMPTQALETWDIVVQTPGDFQNTAVMAIGRGRWFLSSYIKPELMEPSDWDFFAALVRWARHNKQSLVNAWMIGGKPEERDAYGFMFRNPERDLFCARNPWIEERLIELPGLPAESAPRELRMIYPRRATLARLEPGEPGVQVALAPYETVFLESVPAGESTEIRATLNLRASADVSAVVAPWVSASLRRENAEEDFGLRYFWEGAITAPEIAGAELCILVEGAPDVDNTSGKVWLNGREVALRRMVSAGQFGAATDASPDNWVWLIAPLPPGPTWFEIDVSVHAEQASIGVYLRGLAPAVSDPEPEDEGPVFPLYRPNHRAWSQTLMPLTSYVSGAP